MKSSCFGDFFQRSKNFFVEQIRKIRKIREIVSRKNGKAPVICRIKLRDNSTIKVRDEKQVQNCKNLAQKIQIEKLNQFEPENVRFVFEHMLPYIENYENFKETEYYRAGQAFNIDDVLQYMEIAVLLDCQPVLKTLGMIAGYLLRNKTSEELCIMFGLEYDRS